MPSLSPSAPASITRTAAKGFSPIARTIRPATSRAKTTFASGIRPISTQRGNVGRAPLTARRRRLLAHAPHTLRISHQQVEPALVGLLGRQLANDPSATHDQDAVGKRHHLLKLDRHQQDRGPGVAPLQQLPVDEFDGSYIDAASRMADQQYLRLAFQFTSDDQFLLVAAGEIS